MLLLVRLPCLLGLALPRAGLLWGTTTMAEAGVGLPMWACYSRRCVRSMTTTSMGPLHPLRLRLVHPCGGCGLGLCRGCGPAHGCCGRPRPSWRQLVLHSSRGCDDWRHGAGGGMLRPHGLNRSMGLRLRQWKRTRLVSDGRVPPGVCCTSLFARGAPPGAWREPRALSRPSLAHHPPSLPHSSSLRSSVRPELII